MDECHHGGALIAEAVLREIDAKYVYGMTATPKRNDGQEKKVYMQLGPVRYRFTAKEKAELQNIEHYVYPRFTRLVNTGNEWSINEAYKKIISNEIRNNMIVDDAVKCIKDGRTPIIITKFKEHANTIVDMLKNKADNIFLLKGGRGNKERESIRSAMMNIPKSESLVAVAIGQYIGEGFNFPRLDTMLLAAPIAWAGNVEQYAGRLNRDYNGKKEVIIYDYVDIHIRVFEKMYRKRMSAYKNIGYEICTDITDKKQKASSLFDFENYNNIFVKDILEANNEIVISSPGLNKNKVEEFCEQIKEKQEKGIKVTVLTLSSEMYPESRKEITEELINHLIKNGVYIRTFEKMYLHFAIIDSEIVWYGSMNFLSREKKEDSMLRVIAKEIAEELLEIGLNNII